MTKLQAHVVVAVAVAVVALAAEPALALSCTLRKALRVQVKKDGASAWENVSAGTTIVVKSRSVQWSVISTPAGEGRTSTSLLEGACELPPADVVAPPPEPPPKKDPPPKKEPPPKKDPPPKKEPKPKKEPPGKKDPPPPVVPPPPVTPVVPPAPPPPDPPVAPPPVTPVAPPPPVTPVAPPPPVTPLAPPPPPVAPPPPPVAPPPPVTAPVGVPTPLDAADASAKRALRVAVYDFEATNVDKRLTRVVTESVVAELRKLQRVSVVGMDELKAMLDLEAQKQLAGCSEDESCVAEIAEALGVDVVVIGHIAQVDQDLIFSVKRLDQRSAKVVGQVQQRLQSAGGDECLAMVGPAVEQLFPEAPLRDGTTRGVAPEAALRLNPPPLDAWVVWTGAAVTGVAVTAGIAAATVNGVVAAAADSAARASTDVAPVDGANLTGQIGMVRASFWVMTGALVTATVVGAASGVAALFTDWNGYRAAAAAE